MRYLTIMRKYNIIGVIFIAVGTLFMTQLIKDERLILLGVIFNVIGIFCMAKSTYVSSEKSTKEIIDKVSEFRKEINIAKNTKNTVQSSEKIEQVQDEFEKWAEEFIINIESKKIDINKSEIIIKEKEIRLSQEWRHIYEYVFEVVKNMLIAVNNKSKYNIEYKFPKPPNNLFNEEAKNYKAHIIFNKNDAWVIKMQIYRPYKNDEIPNIVIHFYQRDIYNQTIEEFLKTGTGSKFILLDISIDNKCIEIRKSDSNQYIGDIYDSYSIKASKYKNEIYNLFRVLIEYKLTSL